ncbi:lipopolysaccharide biosynthesis protein [Sphingobacterium mizutaii]|uniref:lipopolysaccharide biosynthesis protein n=1 Tax=Sphingobacterium mizutaii TaxID=1010 RepID=UPI00162487FA|nr:lipopolysaccharide biosynthesis protein [Sphingobacterium mizutaii]
MEVSTLKGKSILLISVKFFNYEVLIKKELERLGANVILLDERPSNTFLSKAIIRFKKELFQLKINNYYKDLIVQLTGKKIDIFLLIKGEAVPIFFINFLKDANPGIKLYYYTYDSFKNNPNGLKILSYFDRKFTFDSEDSKNHNLGFRPLFFANEYSKVPVRSKNEYKYDISFVGTAHSDRYTISEFTKEWCKKNKLKMFAFYFSPSKLLFTFNKATKKNFKGFDPKKISFKSLSHSDIIDLYNFSKAILDINHPGQNGLTMRTFETLGARRKLITTNSNIKYYPFYHPNNIWIIDRDDIKYSKEFFESENIVIDQEIYHSMSLTGWVEEVFDLRNSQIWEDIPNIV